LDTAALPNITCEKYDARLNDDEVAFIDSPGDVLYRDKLFAQIGALVDGPPLCLLNVCAFGYHAPADTAQEDARAKLVSALGRGPILKANGHGCWEVEEWYREWARQQEKDWFKQAWDRMAGGLTDQIKGVVTVVNKLDLWQMTDGERFDEEYGARSFFAHEASELLSRGKIKNVQALGGFDHFMGHPLLIKTLSSATQERAREDVINTITDVLA
jgi:hypothetical protein